MKPYITKVIVVDEVFLQDLRELSRTDLAAFSNPGLDTKVVSLPLRDEEIEELRLVMDVSDIRTGSVLVKGGYTDQFVAVDTFSEELVFRKYSLFVQLCIALGAKNVSISNIEDVALEANDSLHMGAEIGASASLAEGEAGFKLDRSALKADLQKCNTNFRTQAEGAEPDLKAAKALIDQYGLHKDSLFTDMLRLREGTNRVTKHELSLDFSKDVKRVFDSSIQAKIKVMAQLYKGKVDFEVARKCVEQNRTATKLSVVVEF